MSGQQQLQLGDEGGRWGVAIEREAVASRGRWRWRVTPPAVAGAPSSRYAEGHAATRQQARLAAAEAIARRRPVHERAVRKHRRRQQLEGAS